MTMVSYNGCTHGPIERRKLRGPARNAGQGIRRGPHEMAPVRKVHRKSTPSPEFTVLARARFVPLLALLHHRPDGGEQFPRRAPFDQVSSHVGLTRRLHDALVGIGGEKHDRQTWVLAAQDAGRLGPAHPRHLDVHQHHVRHRLLDEVDAFSGGRGHSGHLVAHVGEEPGQLSGQVAVVVHHDKARHSRERHTVPVDIVPMAVVIGLWPAVPIGSLVDVIGTQTIT